MAEWHEGLSDEYRGNESLANIPDIDTLAKSYLDAQSYMGGSIRIPSDDAGEDDWSSFNQKLTDKVPTLMNIPSDEAEARAALLSRLGRPAESSGYTTEGLNDDFREWAFENGLTDGQIAALVERNGNDMRTATDAQDEDAREVFDGLKSKWGHAYDQNLSFANRAIETYADEAAIQYIQESGLNENAGFIQMMASIGSQLGEDLVSNIGNQGNSFALAPDEAKSQISEIQNNKAHPYHKGNGEAVTRMAKLFEQAYPS